MNLDQLTSFFGWMTVINTGLIVLTSVLIMSLKGVICRLHGKIFGLGEKEIAVVLYAYIGIYKIFVVVLNFVPYLALKMMG